MAGGRPRTPSKVLQLRGTHRKDRHGQPENEPQFTVLSELPPPPGFFSDVAKAEWHRVGPDLIAKQLLTDVDLAAFGNYCLNVARVVQAERAIDEHGLLIPTEYGLKANPAVAMARQAGAEVRKFSQEFGMTPSSRTRLRTPEPAKEQTDDPWAALGG